MDFIYIGKMVNTHGLKGEIRILSSFSYKEKVFLKGMLLYIGSKKEVKKIVSYRKHKQYDMVVLEGIDSIEKAEDYKGMNVYINKSDLQIDGFFDEDIIGLTAYVRNKKIGVVEDIIISKAHKILVIGKSMIPYIDAFIEKVDLDNKTIEMIDMDGLVYED